MTQPARPQIYASWDAGVRFSGPWIDHPDLGTALRLGSGEAIYHQGDRHAFFYLIREGYVQTQAVRSDGAGLLLEIMGPGTIFGEGAAFDGEPRYVSTIAVCDALLSRYEPAAVAHALAGEPRLLTSLICIMSAKQRSLVGKLAGFSAAPERRLAELMIRVTDVQRRAAPDGPWHLIALTHEQLASMTGLSRVTVTRTLRRLAELGLLATHAKHIEIVSLPALQTHAGD